MSEYEEERQQEASDEAQAYKDSLIDNYLEGMTVDQIEDALNGCTDCLANIWILHSKDEKKRNQLIIQQIESALLNEAEVAVENEYE